MESKSKKRDLRLEMRVKNNILWRAVHELHSTTAAFCKAHNLSQSGVGQLISFKISPFTRAGEYRIAAVRLSEVLGIAVSDLFPPKLYTKMLEIGSFKVAEVNSFTALPKAAQKEINLLPAPDGESPVVLAMRAEPKKAIKDVLKTLSYRERRIIELRYGIDDGYAYTLAEVAHIFRVTQDRIRQIEAKAIRKLQQPKRSQTLVGFLD